MASRGFAGHDPQTLDDFVHGHPNRLDHVKSL
jgi:hypothetical protein